MKNIFFLSLLMMVLGSVTFAQDVDINSGDLSVLKGEKTINIELTYVKMSVGDFGKEEIYIKKRIEELNAKEPGSGDTWAKKWEEDKLNRFNIKFIEGFTGTSGMSALTDSKYTMIVNTKAMEPGYQVGISKRNAGIDGTIIIVETANRNKKIASLYFERPPENKWRGAAFDAGSRIADAFYLTGQKAGKFFKKNIK